MNTKLVAVLVGLAVIVGAAGTWFVVAGHNANTNTKASSTTAQPSKLTIDDAISKMTAAGITVGKKNTAYYQIIGAASGDKVTANTDTTVELYTFSDSKNQTAAKSQLAQSGTIIENGNMLILINAGTDSGNPVDPALIAKIKSVLQ